jgi:hypothetical protein
LRYTPAGQAVANFRVASTPCYMDRTTNEWKDGDSVSLAVKRGGASRPRTRRHLHRDRLHMRPAAEDGVIGFDTHVGPGPLMDQLASACVIAQLELLQAFALVFGWTVDSQGIHELLGEARELNNTAARGEVGVSASSVDQAS